MVRIGDLESSDSGSIPLFPICKRSKLDRHLLVEEMKAGSIPVACVDNIQSYHFGHITQHGRVTGF